MRELTCWWRGILWMVNPKWGIFGGHVWASGVCSDPAWRYCGHCGCTNFNR